MPNVSPGERSDSVQEKLRLLQAAYSQRNVELAMSLVESLKDTLTLEKQTHPQEKQPRIAADHFSRVEDLPPAWGQWAAGWSFCKSMAMFDTIGTERAGEPVEVTVSFRADQTTDLQREVRVARVDPRDAALREVASQLYDEVRRGHERVARLALLADVPSHGRANYLVFYGNSLAELPEYTTDLKSTGEGYALDIENHHFAASLSRQMGQLERLRYKRQHSLELYAGGKGHGEPPTIDWAHDYVDPGQFQKLRIRNWPQPPNWEVVRGPLCVRVRRWGFPYSPIHPVFTPSRIHMDQTYTFYAGLPYFFKESRFEVLKETSIEAMRDDEWVLSGYSFTDTLWIDRQGKLHEGQAPAEDLWGVGFFHRESRDAFVALWLEHAADKFEIHHGGPPTLHYDGHGQLWSRYPANRATLPAGTSLRQRNAYLTSPYPRQGGPAAIESLRHQLLNPVEVRAESLPRISPMRSAGKLARPGETPPTAALKPAIWRTLREVKDEQLYSIDSNIVDLGYVYDVRVRDGVAQVLVTMPHRGRPRYEFLETAGGGRVEPGIRERLRKIDGIRDVVVDFTWEPAWSVARLTDAGRQMLGISG